MVNEQQNSESEESKIELRIKALEDRFMKKKLAVDMVDPTLS